MLELLSLQLHVICWAAQQGIDKHFTIILDVIFKSESVLCLAWFQFVMFDSWRNSPGALAELSQDSFSVTYQLQLLCGGLYLNL